MSADDFRSKLVTSRLLLGKRRLRKQTRRLKVIMVKQTVAEHKHIAIAIAIAITTTITIPPTATIIQKIPPIVISNHQQHERAASPKVLIPPMFISYRRL